MAYDINIGQTQEIARARERVGEPVTPVGSKKYFALAEERIEGPIQAACLVEAGGWVVLNAGRRFSLLVLTTDELRLFSLRWAGWRDPFRDALDAELMRVPLGAVERLDNRPSIMPMVKAFRLTFTDGNRLALRAVRGVNHGADVIERLTDLITTG